MNNRPTTLRLPGHLPYPITVTSLLVQPESPVKKHDGLLVYKFYTTSSEEDREDQDEREPERNKEMVDQFDSPWEGILTEWHIKEGETIHSSRFDAFQRNVSANS
jgi:RNA polymerase II subunit A C-terminal domain phosphatase